MFRFPMRFFAALFAVLFLVPASLASAEEAEKPEVKEATREELKHELMMFEREFDTVDIDFQLKAVKRLSNCIHEDVTNELLKLLFRHPDVNVRAEAARGLANQTPWVKTIGRKITPLLEDKDTDPKVLVAVTRTLGVLGYTRAWEQIADLSRNDEDDVVIAAFGVLGDWGELRAWREIQLFWDMYPEDGKFATGTVTVDTGAAGDVDARAAKAKWKAKYGGGAKLRPRPECVRALKAAVEKITGEKLEKPDAFREWLGDNKQKVKAAERKRD